MPARQRARIWRGPSLHRPGARPQRCVVVSVPVWVALYIYIYIYIYIYNVYYIFVYIFVYLPELAISVSLCNVLMFDSVSYLSQARILTTRSLPCPTRRASIFSSIWKPWYNWQYSAYWINSSLSHSLLSFISLNSIFFHSFSGIDLILI